MGLDVIFFFFKVKFQVSFCTLHFHPLYTYMQNELGSRLGLTGLPPAENTRDTDLKQEESQDGSPL